MSVFGRRDYDGQPVIVVLSRLAGFPSYEGHAGSDEPQWYHDVAP